MDTGKRRKGCAHPRVADTHTVSWLRASSRKARSIARESNGHATAWAQPSRGKGGPLRLLRTPMGPHGLSVRREGRTDPGEGSWSWGLSDPQKGREGGTAPRAARAHGPPSTCDSAERARRSTEKASRLGLFDARVDGKALPIGPMGDLLRGRGGAAYDVKAFPVAGEGCAHGCPGAMPSKGFVHTHDESRYVFGLSGFGAAVRASSTRSRSFMDRVLRLAAEE